MPGRYNPGLSYERLNRQGVIGAQPMSTLNDRLVCWLKSCSGLECHWADSPAIERYPPGTRFKLIFVRSQPVAATDPLNTRIELSGAGALKSIVKMIKYETSDWLGHVGRDHDGCRLRC